MRRLEHRWEGSAMSTHSVNFAARLEDFFTRRVIQQRQASPHTISYSFLDFDFEFPHSYFEGCMLLAWAKRALGCASGRSCIRFMSSG
jgi:hypothetical protein